MRRRNKHIIQPILLQVTVTILMLFGFFNSCNLNNEWDDYYNNPPERSGDNILTIIGDNENYSSFYDKLMEYGFDELLSKNQYFTVFVPPNSAFEGSSNYTSEEWTQIIGFHIIYASLYSRDFEDLDLLTTIGKYLNMRSNESGEIKIFESAINMSNVDFYCQNGVIHEIDKLLIPKPNVYEYIMSLDDNYSILKDFLNSMDKRFIDYEKSERIGVNDNGDAIYDTVWRSENFFLDNIAGLDDEAEAYTGFLPANEHVQDALNSVSEYFGDIEEMDEETYAQLLFITFSGSFVEDAYLFNQLPDTIVAVTGNLVPRTDISAIKKNQVVSNGMIHLLDDMTIPKSFFLLPITIECDKRAGRTVSNTLYSIEQLSDSRASNGSYVWYNCRFEGDYLEFKVDMVLKTTYQIVWTGPKQGPSQYQIFVQDEETGEFVNVGPPVDNWRKGAFKLVESGPYTFKEFGTKTVRIVIVDELPIVGLNSIYVDYIKLIPDEIYNP